MIKKLDYYSSYKHSLKDESFKRTYSLKYSLNEKYSTIDIMINRIENYFQDYDELITMKMLLSFKDYKKDNNKIYLNSIQHAKLLFIFKNIYKNYTDYASYITIVSNTSQKEIKKHITYLSQMLNDDFVFYNSYLSVVKKNNSILFDEKINILNNDIVHEQYGHLINAHKFDLF